MEEEKDLRYYAKVHSIETFGAVDGPGIRFVLFLQGCHLQCKYCHNRDTWDMKEGKYQSVDDIYKMILKYKNYITPNGGVTVSGGEPLLQVKFLIELFTKLKKKKIHTCIDTSGMVALTDDIKQLLTLTDLVLLDVKHIDSEKCKDLVGFDNKLELAFAKYLSENNIPIWIRQVIVPGINDTKENILDLKKYLKKINNIKLVELLPYHTYGKEKYKKLGISYRLKNIEDMNVEKIKELNKLLKD